MILLAVFYTAGSSLDTARGNMTPTDATLPATHGAGAAYAKAPAPPYTKAPASRRVLNNAKGNSPYNSPPLGGTTTNTAPK